MTVRAAIISSGGTGISRPIIDLICDFKNIASKKRKLVMWAPAVADVFVIIARVSRQDGQPGDSSIGDKPNDNGSGPKTSGSATNSDRQNMISGTNHVASTMNHDRQTGKDLFDGNILAGIAAVLAVASDTTRFFTNRHKKLSTTLKGANQ